jgi:hypothetical protein
MDDYKDDISGNDGAHFNANHLGTSGFADRTAHSCTAVVPKLRDKCYAVPRCSFFLPHAEHDIQDGASHGEYYLKAARAPGTELNLLRAAGPTVLTTEIFGWRAIRNGRQLGALVGSGPRRITAARRNVTMA